MFHFNETTTSQIKKQYDGYDTYKTNTGNVTTYFGSLFVGRCSAVKLKEHMFEFSTKHQLEISNLVSICTNGPNVNQKFHRKTEEAPLQMIIMGYFQLDPVPYTSLTMDLLSALSAFINLD